MFEKFCGTIEYYSRIVGRKVTLSGYTVMDFDFAVYSVWLNHLVFVRL